MGGEGEGAVQTVLTIEKLLFLIHELETQRKGLNSRENTVKHIFLLLVCGSHGWVPPPTTTPPFGEGGQRKEEEEGGEPLSLV